MALSRITVEGVENYSHHYPRIAIVVSAACDGTKDAMVAAWHTPLSANPPLYGVAVAEKRYTYELINKSQTFAINFLPMEKIQLVAALGATKGKEVDKFQAFAVSWRTGVKIAAPILEDAYATYECNLVGDHIYGDHHLLVGEILTVHYLKDAFDPDGRLVIHGFRPILYLGKDTYLDTARANMLYCDRKKAADNLSINKG